MSVEWVKNGGVKSVGRMGQIGGFSESCKFGANKHLSQSVFNVFYGAWVMCRDVRRVGIRY